MNTDALKKLWQAAFNEPMEAINGFFDLAYSPDRCRILEEKGQIVSALYWFDCEYGGGKLAYIYAVATDPAHRGKGFASRLLEETHTFLKKQDYAGVVLKPANGLFPFYERLGYSTCGFIRRFPAEAGNLPATLKKLSPAEYGRLRRSYLPENGIIQEGITLDYLHSFADLYGTEDALFCVSRQEPVFFEYLGTPNSAPGILAALGMQSAEIPTAGNDIPFAMFLPLNCTKIPGYLGITLE